MQHEKVQVMKNNMESYAQKFSPIPFSNLVISKWQREQIVDLSLTFGLKFHTTVRGFLVLEVRKLLVLP